jgi:hypothetical protein
MTGLQTTVYAEYKCMSVFYLRTKLHEPGSNCSFVTAIEPNPKQNIRSAVILLYITLGGSLTDIISVLIKRC